MADFERIRLGIQHIEHSRWIVSRSTHTCFHRRRAAPQNFNTAMADFGRNWLAHARRAGIRNALVGCADAACGAAVEAGGVACVDIRSFVCGDDGGATTGDQWKQTF